MLGSVLVDLPVPLARGGGEVLREGHGERMRPPTESTTANVAGIRRPVRDRVVEVALELRLGRHASPRPAGRG